MADVSTSTTAPEIPQATAESAPGCLPDRKHIDSSSEPSGRQFKRRGVLSMATVLAGCAAAAAVIPFKSETGRPPTAPVEAPHPDQAIFDLCEKCRSEYAKYKGIAKHEDEVQQRLMRAGPNLWNSTTRFVWEGSLS